MRTLYFDCFSGISGDMTIGALIDLGVDFHALKAELEKLHLSGYEIAFERAVRAHITGTKFQVQLANHAHADHQHSHEHSHEHTHEHKHEHIHEYTPEHVNHEHAHAERRLADIHKMLDA